MAQPVSSSRLTNTSLNMIGADGRVANYGSTGIGVTGGNFDISSRGTLTLGSTGNVTLGNAGGIVDITNGTVNSLNGVTSGSTVTIGGNLSTGSLFLGNTGGVNTLYGSTVNIGNTGSTAIVNGTLVSNTIIPYGNSIFIGTAGSTATVNGTLIANTIYSTAVGTGMNIGGNVTSSNIKIGENLTNGSVVIGNTGGSSKSALYGSNVQIGSTGSTIQIGFAGGANTSSLYGSNVQIGSTGSTIQIGFAGGVNTSSLYGSSIQIGDTGSAVTIGTSKSKSITVGDTAFPVGVYGKTIEIGGFGSTTTLGITGSTAFINGNNILIGSGGVGNVVIGNSNTGTITLNNTTTVNSLNSGNPSGTFYIARNMTSGGIGIANESTHTGAIYVGTSSNRGGNAEFGSGGTGYVIIGNTTAPLSLRGSTIELSGTTSVSTLDSGTLGGPMNVGSNITSGSIYIANNSAFTGVISIGANSTTRAGAMNIGTLGSGTVSIGNTNAPLSLKGSSTTFSSPLTLGSAPTSGTTAQLGSYSISTPANVTGIAAMNILAPFTSLPIGIYILNGSTFINSNSVNSSLQFGYNGTVQNANLQNIITYINSVAGVARITVLWVQTSVENVYFSGSGAYNFQNICASYVRIG